MLAARRLLLTFLLLQLAACAATPPRNTANVCNMFEDRRNWYRAAQDAEQQWQIPIAVTMAFIQQESGFRARARPPRTRILWLIPGPRPSDAMGYAQALESTWEDYKRATGRRWASRSDFADAVDFVGWYNSNSNRINGIARNDAYNLYLAYHEGNGGFSRRTYADKQWLLDTAGRVQASANLYEDQFRQCENELGRNWFQRLFS
jgi:hypothetical protein